MLAFVTIESTLEKYITSTTEIHPLPRVDIIKIHATGWDDFSKLYNYFKVYSSFVIMPRADTIDM